MSKERANRLKLILARVQQNSELPEDKAADEAIFQLIGEALNNLARIADALEKRATVAPMGEGLVMGELAKFEPAIAPEMVERLLKAMEQIAAAPR